MIVDRLENIGNYSCLGKNFETAARWLKETDLAQLETGTVKIDGDRVYVMVQENWLDRETPAYEYHCQYADIQLVLNGRERFLQGWKGTEGRQKPGADVYFCDAGESLEFVLGPDQFAVFLPGELHAPGNPDGAPAACRKLVVKVRMTEDEPC